MKTQFKTNIQSFQCDNGGEYNNAQFQTFFSNNGIKVRFSCPHTSQQNGRSERMIRTINNTIRTLLFQARLSPVFWVEALHTAVHLLNILPSTSIENNIPYQKLFHKKPTYDHLKTFGSLCYPNNNHSFLHKLAPRSAPSIFLGYPTNHKGYRCMDLKTRKIIISRHVVFDETIFPATEPQIKDSSNTYKFLETSSETSPLFQQILQAPMESPVPPTIPAPSPPTVAPVPPPTSRHSMTTRSQDGTRKQRSFCLSSYLFRLSFTKKPPSCSFRS